MSFESYRKEADKKWFKYREKMTASVAQQERDRFYQLFTAYTNKQLVRVTWILAVATILLSVITLILK
jgi:hypothetical protein